MHPAREPLDGAIGNSLPSQSMKRLQVYPSPEITVTFDPNLCVHSGVCVRTLPGVFDVRRARWIDVDRAQADEIARAIDRCPSGALAYYRNPERDPSAKYQLTKAVLLNRLTLAATEDESRDTRARKIAEFIQEARGYPWVGLYDVLEDEIVAIAWTGDVAPAGSTRTELVVSVLDPASKEVVGTIAVESDRVDAFDHQDVELIEACARAAARVWER
jgi:uncharacterized Fe-S cluster protein YjdI/putative methionine-R-sulfoxide reductase with GAF domain